MRRLIALAAVLAAALATAVVATADRGGDGKEQGGTIAVALIGDTPYGVANGDTTELADTPNLIAGINGDPAVSLTLHVGDIHSGSDHCYQTYDQKVFDMWQGVSGSGSAGFAKPLVYTPGDNEWTDCNKQKEGGLKLPSAPLPGCTTLSAQLRCDGYYDTSQGGHLPGDPLDNLALVRSIFFPVAGQSLGLSPIKLHSQGKEGPKQYRAYVENVWWEREDVVFGTLDLPGSNDDGLPWYTLSPLSQRQQDEVSQRNAANSAWLDRIFDQASEEHAKAVVIGVQADMWDPAAAVAGGDGLDGYDAFVQHLAARTLAFGKPVLLVNGDSHVFNADNPLGAGYTVDGVADIHHVGYPVPNFQRITVQGKTTKEWLKLTIAPESATVFSWQRISLP